MNKNIEHYVFHKENFLDEKYCENCIDELDKCTWKKHEWYIPKTDKDFTPSGDNEPEVLEADMFSFEIGEINESMIQNLHSVILEYERK